MWCYYFYYMTLNYWITLRLFDMYFFCFKHHVITPSYHMSVLTKTAKFIAVFLTTCLCIKTQSYIEHTNPLLSLRQWPFWEHHGYMSWHCGTTTSLYKTLHLRLSMSIYFLFLHDNVFCGAPWEKIPMSTQTWDSTWDFGTYRIIKQQGLWHVEQPRLWRVCSLLGCRWRLRQKHRTLSFAGYINTSVYKRYLLIWNKYLNLMRWPIQCFLPEIGKQVMGLPLLLATIRTPITSNYEDFLDDINFCTIKLIG